jgi:glycosyltransferase involved in cell wall biosynthesis
LPSTDRIGLPHVPLLTVVLPTYRRPDFLRRALNSVLQQTFRDLVVLVCDNASGDETPQVVSEIAASDPRVRYHLQPVNVGLERNFALGLRLVDTPFFTFLADDDLVLPNGYAARMKCFDDHPDTMVSCGETLHVIAPRQLYDLYLHRWTPGPYEPPSGAFAVLQHGLPFWSSMIFRHEVVDRVGLIDPETGALIDLDFVLRVALECKLFVDKTPCAIYFSHPAAVSRIKHLDYVWPGWLRLTKNVMALANFPEESRQAIERLLLKRFAAELAFASLGCIRKGRFDEGLEGGRILRHQTDRKLLGLGIGTLAVTARTMPFLTRSMTMANDVRRWVASRQINQHEFEAHLKLLDT